MGNSLQLLVFLPLILTNSCKKLMDQLTLNWLTLSETLSTLLLVELVSKVLWMFNTSWVLLLEFQLLSMLLTDGSMTLLPLFNNEHKKENLFLWFSPSLMDG